MLSSYSYVSIHGNSESNKKGGKNKLEQAVKNWHPRIGCGFAAGFGHRHCDGTGK